MSTNPDIPLAIMRDHSVTIRSYRGTSPQIAANVFLAAGVRIIGDVVIGQGSSVWYNVVIRGDVNFVRIGELTNIQDCAMLHVTRETHPLVIGDQVTIGHSVNLHGCTLQDRCLVGIGAVVLDGALIETEAMVAAGAVVTPGTIVRSGLLYAGVPAKPIRPLTAAERADFEASALRYARFVELSLEEHS